MKNIWRILNVILKNKFTNIYKNLKKKQIIKIFKRKQNLDWGGTSLSHVEPNLDWKVPLFPCGACGDLVREAPYSSLGVAATQWWLENCYEPACIWTVMKYERSNVMEKRWTIQGNIMEYSYAELCLRPLLPPKRNLQGIYQMISD